MQVPNLTGHIVYVVGEHGQPLRTFVCTDHQPTYLIGVPVEGGLFARLTTLPLSQYTLLAFAHSQQMVGHLLQSIVNVLNMDSGINLTSDGIDSLKASRDALSVIVRAFVEENTRQEREDFDSHVREARATEDEARRQYFENLGRQAEREDQPVSQSEPEPYYDDSPAIAGATFTERPWTQQTEPESLGEGESLDLGGTQVRVYIVVEHENQEIVKKVTAAIRHQIHTAIG